MKMYVVFHDYGCYEGWKIATECDELAEAIEARERDISNGGGTSEIFMHIPQKSAHLYAAILGAMSGNVPK